MPPENRTVRGLGAGDDGGERPPQLSREAGERRDARRCQQLGRRPRHHRPVEQGVARCPVARRRSPGRRATCRRRRGRCRRRTWSASAPDTARMCRSDRRQSVAVARVEQVGGHDAVADESYARRRGRGALPRAPPSARSPPTTTTGTSRCRSRPGSGRAATAGWRSSPPGRRRAPADRGRGVRRPRRRAADRPGPATPRAARRRATPCAARHPTSAIRRTRR